MLESKLYSVLTGNNAVALLVGARVYPVKLEQDTEFPAITYQRISGGQQYSLTAYSNLENPRIQIDVWGLKYSDVKALAAKVKTAMEGATTFRATLLTDIDLYEDDVEIYRVSQDWSVWNQE